MSEATAEMRELTDGEMLRLVQRAIRTSYGILPAGVEQEELEQIGMLACLETMLRYDPSRGIPPGGFLWPRVRGRIVDEAWRLVGTPRSRDRVVRREMQESGEQWETRSARAELHGRVRANPERFSGAAYAERGCQTLHGGTEDQPDRAAAMNRQRRALRKAVRSLDETGCTIIKALYVDGKSMRDLAAELGRSKSWVCRIHLRALASLRQELRGMVEDAGSTGLGRVPGEAAPPLSRVPDAAGMQYEVAA